MTQAAIEVANDLPRNGPSGWYSQAWMSRALQSLTSSTPKTWSRNADAGHRLADGGSRLRRRTRARARCRAVGSARSAARSSCGDFDLPGRTDDGRPADDDGARATVVADRQVPPVRQERLGVGAEETPEVRRVLERRVEVDVVGDLERKVRASRRRAARARRRASTSSSTRATVSSHDERPSARNALSEPASNTAPRPAAARSRIPSPTRNPTRGAPSPTENTPKPTAPFTTAASRAPRAPRPARRSCSSRSSGRRSRARGRAPSAEAERSRHANAVGVERERVALGLRERRLLVTLEDDRRQEVEEAVLAVSTHGVVEAGRRLEHEPALAAAP